MHQWNTLLILSSFFAVEKLQRLFSCSVFVAVVLLRFFAVVIWKLLFAVVEIIIGILFCNCYCYCWFFAPSLLLLSITCCCELNSCYLLCRKYCKDCWCCCFLVTSCLSLWIAHCHADAAVAVAVVVFVGILFCHCCCCLLLPIIKWTIVVCCVENIAKTVVTVGFWLILACHHESLAVMQTLLLLLLLLFLLVVCSVITVVVYCSPL